MNIVQEMVESLRALDPDRPSSPVQPPKFYSRQFAETMQGWTTLLPRESAGYKDLADLEALQFRAQNRRRLAWLKIRAEFMTIAAGNARLIELFTMAENAPPGGY